MEEKDAKVPSPTYLRSIFRSSTVKVSTPKGVENEEAGGEEDDTSVAGEAAEEDDDDDEEEEEEEEEEEVAVFSPLERV